MAFIFRVSMLFVDKTVTVVALKEWFVRLGTMPAFSVIFRSMFRRYVPEFSFFAPSVVGWGIELRRAEIFWPLK